MSALTKAELQEENKRLARELATYKLSFDIAKAELAAYREAIAIVLQPHGPEAVKLVDRVANAMTSRGF